MPPSEAMEDHELAWLMQGYAASSCAQMSLPWGRVTCIEVAPPHLLVILSQLPIPSVTCRHNLAQITNRSAGVCCACLMQECHCFAPVLCHGMLLVCDANLTLG